MQYMDLCSPTRDPTHDPAVESQSPHHWTMREFTEPFKGCDFYGQILYFNYF